MSPAAQLGENPLSPLETRRLTSRDILGRKEDKCANEATCQSLAVFGVCFKSKFTNILSYG